MNTYTIEMRERVFINTDPQRRCYNGCHYSSEYVWTKWDWLNLEVPENEVDDKLMFWRNLTAYAVKCRGKSAEAEYRKVLNADTLSKP